MQIVILRMNKVIIRGICLCLFFVLMTILFHRAFGFLSAASDSANTGEQLVMMRTNRRGIEVPLYLLPDDGVDQSNLSHCQDSDRKKLRIQISHLLFLDSLFHMILFPTLLFSIIIRLFGKNLHVRLWKIISYIHMKDADEGSLPVY